MATRGRVLPRAATQANMRDQPVWQTLLLGFAPLLALYILYSIVRWTVSDRGASIGDRNADWVLRFEHWLGVDWELAIQNRFLDHTRLIEAANYYYVFAFFPVLIASAVIAIFRAPQAFHYWRRVFAVSLAFALLGFALFPLTPPRLLPVGAGYVDTLLLYGPHYYGDAQGASLFNAYGSLPSMVNVYAAMPSMHVGWSVLAGALLVASFPGHRWLVALAAIHVLVMAFVVIVTGNHYVIDGIAGVLVLALAIGVVRATDNTQSCPAPHGIDGDQPITP